jgi:hypothetical protein
MCSLEFLSVRTRYLGGYRRLPSRSEGGNLADRGWPPQGPGLRTGSKEAIAIALQIRIRGMPPGLRDHLEFPSGDRAGAIVCGSFYSHRRMCSLQVFISLYVIGLGALFSRTSTYLTESWPRVIRISKLLDDDGTIARIHRLKQKRCLP